MKNILGFTMIAVGFTRIFTGGIITGIILVAWGTSILKRNCK